MVPNPLKVQGVIYGVAGVGLLALLYFMRKRGLLKTVGQGLLGDEGLGDTVKDIIAGEDLEVQVLAPVSAPPIVLASENTSAAPGTDKPFVIPYTGQILNPVEGGRVDKSIFSTQYYVEVEVNNNTDKSVTGEIVVETSQGRYTASATIGAGQSARRKIPCETGRIYNPFGWQETAFLKFLGRQLDYVSYYVS